MLRFEVREEKYFEITVDKQAEEEEGSGWELGKRKGGVAWRGQIAGHLPEHCSPCSLCAGHSTGPGANRK